MVEGLLPVILGIVKDGMALWSEERRTRFMKKHHNLIQDLSNAENKTHPDYNDSDVDLLRERLRNFLQAYWSELREEGVASLQSGKGQS